MTYLGVWLSMPCYWGSVVLSTLPARDLQRAARDLQDCKMASSIVTHVLWEWLRYPGLPYPNAASSQHTECPTKSAHTLYGDIYWTVQGTARLCKATVQGSVRQSNVVQGNFLVRAKTTSKSAVTQSSVLIYHHSWFSSFLNYISQVSQCSFFGPGHVYAVWFIW